MAQTRLTVVATSEIKANRSVVVMNGLAREAYHGEPTTVRSTEDIAQGNVLIYNPDMRTIQLKR